MLEYAFKDHTALHKELPVAVELVVVERTVENVARLHQHFTFQSFVILPHAAEC